MRAEVDGEGRDVELAVTRQPLAAQADREQVARAQLRPVRPVGVEQEAVAAARHGQAEVVVDALVEAVERGGAQRGGEFDAGQAEPGGIRGEVERRRHLAIVTASGNARRRQSRSPLALDSAACRTTPSATSPCAMRS